MNTTTETVSADYEVQITRHQSGWRGWYAVEIAGCEVEQFPFNSIYERIGARAAARDYARRHIEEMRQDVEEAGE